MLEKLEKENSFLRKNLQDKNIKILLENIIGLIKKIITQSFSYNQNVKENSNKDGDRNPPKTQMFNEQIKLLKKNN